MPLQPSNWAAVGAQVTGPAHLDAGGVCEDSFAAASTADGRHCFLVVADGAGSAARASTGSRLASHAALEAMLDVGSLVDGASPAAWEEHMRTAFAAAREALVVEAEASGGELRDLHTTLLIAGLTDLGTHPQLVAAGIGDGAIVVGDGEGYCSVSVTPRGEYANETVFLTDANASDKLQFHAAPATTLTMLAVMSDGVEALAVEARGTRPVSGFFGKVARHLARGGDPAAVTEVLASERAATQCDDDKTLLMLVPNELAAG